MLTEVHSFLKTILLDTKFVRKTFFVGGSVRDHIRDKKAHDIDVVVDMLDGAKDLSNFIFEAVKNSFPIEYKNIITFPFQLGHYPIYSITFKDNFEFKNHFYLFKDLTIEIADTMIETFPDEHSRQRDVEHGSIYDDIMRRDFTINSGLIDVVSFEFLDLTPNKTILNDIEKGIIRCNKDDVEYIDKVFSNDPLRILRGLVFAARFNFKIDETVKVEMIKNVERLKIVSRERINAEIKKAFDVQNGIYRLVKLVNEINALDVVFPKISTLKNVYQCNRNEDGSFYPDVRKIHLEGKTVFDHVMAVLKFTKKGYLNGLAALYHDVGKIYPEYKNGKVRFLHHEEIGAKIVEELFPKMKIDNETTKNVKFLIANHMKLHLLKDLSKKSLRRFIREIPSNELRFRLYDLCNADCLGTVQEVDGIVSSAIPHYEAIELVENLIKEDFIVVEKPFRYFNGNEIMKILNISGKPVGTAIDIMLKLQDEYGFNKDKEFIKKQLINRFRNLKNV